GLGAKYYAFDPKDVIDLCGDQELFRQGRKWSIAADSLRALRDTCRAAGAELILVYVPEKAHVVLPLAADRIPLDKLRAFIALQTKMKLPEPKALLDQLLARIDGKESVVAEWCRAQSVSFLSLTHAMREIARTGRQPYYTFDQHWTPIGHDAAAKAV